MTIIIISFYPNFERFNVAYLFIKFFHRTLICDKANLQINFPVEQHQNI